MTTVQPPQADERSDAASRASTPHTYTEYGEALAALSRLVLRMCAMAARQLALALESLASGGQNLIDEVLEHEAAINELERMIDSQASQIIARWQPAARDLRLLLAFAKSTTDLERVGDEAKKIALQARKLYADRRPPLQHVELRTMAAIAREMLHASERALEDMNPDQAAEASRRDEELDGAFRGALR